MFMRFRGGGVGHKSTREATDFFKNDRHQLDIDRRNSRNRMDTEEDHHEAPPDVGTIESETRVHEGEQSQRREDVDDEEDGEEDDEEGEGEEDEEDGEGEEEEEGP